MDNLQTSVPDFLITDPSVSPPANNIFRIALGYQSRVGKDTFANYVIDQYSSNHNTVIAISFAEGIYKIVSGIQLQLGMPVVKDPILLQNIGTLIRVRYGDSIWINQLLERIKDYQYTINGSISFIITDLRFPDELLAVKELGFTTIKITRNDRTIDRDPNHISEIALKDVNFDYHIANDSSKQDLFDSIDLIMQRVVVKGSCKG